MKLGTPTVYNADEKVWSGPKIDKQVFDLPLGETLLNALQKHGEKLIQVRKIVGLMKNVLYKVLQKHNNRINKIVGSYN